MFGQMAHYSGGSNRLGLCEFPKHIWVTDWRRNWIVSNQRQLSVVHCHPPISISVGPVALETFIGCIRIGCWSLRWVWQLGARPSISTLSSGAIKNVCGSASWQTLNDAYLRKDLFKILFNLIAVGKPERDPL